MLQPYRGSQAFHALMFNSISSGNSLFATCSRHRVVGILCCGWASCAATAKFHLIMLSHWLLAHHVWYDVGCDGPDGVTLGPRWISLVYLYKVPLWGGVDSTSIPGRCKSKKRGTGVPMTLVISGTVFCCCCTGQGTPNKKQGSNKGRRGCDLQENKKGNYPRASLPICGLAVYPRPSARSHFSWRIIAEYIAFRLRWPLHAACVATMY